jgi:hypothetical protein
MMENTTETPTFDHPLHLILPRIQRPLNPTFLPRKELDELDLRKTNVSQLGHTPREQKEQQRKKEKESKEQKNQKKNQRTAPINSFNTPILLSLAASTPFCIRTLRRAIRLFSGHPAMSTMNPAKALHPRSLKSGWGGLG